MKDLWQNLKNWQKVGIIGGVLLLIVIVIVAAINISKNMGPNVKINFEGDVNIPSDELMKIREKLAGVIKDNTKDFDSNIVYEGNARDYQESISDDNSVAVFIVDFDEIKESYIVEAYWPDLDDDVPNVVVACPLLSSKYPETPCVTEINSSLDITSYLPYEGVDSNNKEYKVEGNYSGGKLYLEITSDDNPEEALTAVKDWIKSINLNPDDYLFFVPAKQYIQANHANTKDANVNKNLPYFVPGMYDVYPVVDDSGNVTSIKAELSGCTDAQTDSEEEEVNTYLRSKGINYPVEFEYCAN